MENSISQAKVIITGSTGMVGRGVLNQCLESEFISKILVVNRRPLDVDHPKLEELIVPDFDHISEHAQAFQNYDACFHCMGISAVGLSEQEYAHVTFGYTKQLVDVCYSGNPEMVFNYVSGDGTSTKENSRMMWANVKGRTENMILAQGFSKAYMFRPGVIIPEKGIRSRTKYYQTIYDIIRPLFPLLKNMKSITTTTRIGDAMINTLRFPIEIKYLYNKDINELAK